MQRRRCLESNTFFSIIIIIFTPRLLSVYSILWKLMKKRLLKSISGGEKKEEISCCVPKKRAIEYHRRSVWVLRRGGRSFGMRSNESLNKKKGGFIKEKPARKKARTWLTSRLIGFSLRVKSYWQLNVIRLSIWIPFADAIIHDLFSEIIAGMHII